MSSEHKIEKKPAGTVSMFQSDRRFDLAAELMGQAVWEWDCANDHLVFSEHFYSWFGYTPAQIQPDLAGWFKLIHRSDRSSTSLALYDYLEGATRGFAVELRMRDSDGDYRWLSVSGKVVEWEQDDDREQQRPIRIMGVLLDIDERKSAEVMLCEAHEQVLIHNTTLKRGMGEVEENLRLAKGALSRQQRLLSLLERMGQNLVSARENELESLIGQALGELCQTVGATRACIMRSVEKAGEQYVWRLYNWQQTSVSRETDNRECDFPCSAFGDWYLRLSGGETIKASGGEIPEAQRAFFTNVGMNSVLLLPIHINGQYWGLVYFADPGELRYSEDSELKTLKVGVSLLAQSVVRLQARGRLDTVIDQAKSATQAKSLFLANMSHELLTPLNAINGMATIAQQDPDRVDECLHQICDASGHLQRLISDVLEVSQIESSGLDLVSKPFSLDHMVNRVYGDRLPSALAKQHQMTLRIDTDLPDLLVGDEARMSQVLDHLVSNAIKFTPRGGRIRIEADQLGKKSGRVDLRISVTDNGIGVDVQAIDRLFAPFEQAENRLSRNYQGAGLGLTLAHEIIQSMGGDIDVETASGEGSTFSFQVSLPYVAAMEPSELPQPEQQEQFLAAQYDFSGKRILLVEDIEVNAMIVTSMLEATRAEVHIAENGRRACDIIAEYPNRYDLVFMDIQMPEMDGYEATREIRRLGIKSGIRVPIVALTANAFNSDVEKCLEAGMDGHLAKPVKQQQLLETANQYLGDGRMAMGEPGPGRKSVIV